MACRRNDVDYHLKSKREAMLTEIKSGKRIRNAIKKYGGDQNLLALADEELDGAMGLITSVNGKKCPTVAGLLLLGNEILLRRHLPAYEVAFQVMRQFTRQARKIRAILRAQHVCVWQIVLQQRKVNAPIS